MYVLVEFDYGASRSFILPAFSRSFDVALRAFDHLIVFKADDEYTVSTLWVFRDCVIEIIKMRFPIDLSPIPMNNISVVIM